MAHRRCSCGHPPVIAGAALSTLSQERGENLTALRAKIEKDVRYANITIIEGHDASQYGIGIVSARIAQMVLRDERGAIPIGSYQRKFGVTLSLPSVVSCHGVTAILKTDLSAEERWIAAKRGKFAHSARARHVIRRLGHASRRPQP
jgi:L-lactate dehydrogenase